MIIRGIHSRRFWRARCNLHQQFAAPCLFLIESLERRTLLSVGGPAIAPTSIVEGAIAAPGSVVSSPITPAAGALSSPFNPTQLIPAYGAGNISFNAVTGNGSGQTIAIVDVFNDPNIIPDANTFSSTYSLPQFNTGSGPTLTVLNEYGNATNLPPNSTAGDDWTPEESLDVEWAHAIAPRANIILFEASEDTYDTDALIAETTAAGYPGVSVVSNSWSEPEFDGETSEDGNFTTPSGHPGVTFLASTGDTGKPGGYPADSPNVVAVGGTALTINNDGSYGGETGWNSSGGGISSYESQPAYQAGNVNGANATQRTIPDVAMIASGASGQAVVILDTYYGNEHGNPAGWYGESGTSLSCPLWAGLIAIANQGRALAGLGSLNGATQTLPALYNLSPSVFHDITSGNNGFAAGPGYDLVTGIGSPIANTLVPALVNATSPSHLAFSQQPGNTLAGSMFSPAITVNIEYGNGSIITSDNSSVTLAIYSGPGGATLLGNVTVAAVNGVATFGNVSLTTPGNYTLQASDGSFPAVISNAFSVTPAAAVQVVFVQQPGGGTVGQPITPALTVDVEDSFGNLVTGDHSNVTLAVASGPGTLAGTTTVAAVAGVATFGNVSLTAAGNYTLNAADGALTGATSNRFTISQFATTIAVTSSNSAVNYGQAVTFTATVTPSGGSGETGTVQFVIDGGNSGNPITLSGNTATYTPATLSAGWHTVVAIYSGDGNFAGSTSATLTQIIAPDWLNPASAATWISRTQTLTVTGTATITGDPANFGDTPTIVDSGTAGNLTVDTLVADGGDGDPVVHIAAISGNGATTINAGSSLDVGNFTQAILLNNGATEIDGNGTIGNLTGNGSLTIGNGSSTNTLALATQTTSGILSGFRDTQTALTIRVGATLDITNNVLLLNYASGSSPLAAVDNAVAWGSSHGTNANGAIISSTVNANSAGKYAVGYADHTEISTVPTGNVEVAYTLTGDATLDGSVDILDYQQLAPHYDEAGTYDWSQGDFTHDGHVDILDYQAMAPNYDTKLAAGALAGAAAQPAPPAAIPAATTAQPSSAALTAGVFANTAITSRVPAMASSPTAPAAHTAATPVYRLYTPTASLWSQALANQNQDNTLASQFGWTADAGSSYLL